MAVHPFAPKHLLRRSSPLAIREEDFREIFEIVRVPQYPSAMILNEMQTTRTGFADIRNVAGQRFILFESEPSCMHGPALDIRFHDDDSLRKSGNDAIAFHEAKIPRGSSGRVFAGEASVRLQNPFGQL